MTGRKPQPHPGSPDGLATRSLRATLSRALVLSLALAGGAASAQAPAAVVPAPSADTTENALPAVPADPPTVGPAYRTTTLEVGSVMALGLGIYIYKGERNAYDWPLTLSRVEERFTTLRQFRFDDNEFAMNNVAHPIAGALYYRFARSNGFGPLGASLYAIGGSTFWEVVVELREIASLNDLISTPAAGIALGEALHQHTEFFRRGAPGVRNSLLEKAFSGPILINRLFGETAPTRAASLTPSGLPADRPHRLRIHGSPVLRLEAGRTDDSAPPREGWLVALGATSELGTVKPPDDGDFRETGGLPLTRLEANVGFTEAVPTELYVGAETVWDGWRRATLEARPDGRIRGSRWLLGPATAFTMRLDHSRDTRFMELMANAHLLGMRADGVVRNDPVRVRWNAAAYADFSSVRPLALYSRREGLSPAHAVMARNIYYYAYGATVRSRLEADAGPIGIRAEVDHHTFTSISEPHRHHPELGRSELTMEDTRTYGRGWLELRPTQGTTLALGVDHSRGWGRLNSETVRDRETRLRIEMSAMPW